MSHPTPFDPAVSFVTDSMQGALCVDKDHIVEIDYEEMPYLSDSYT